MPQETIRNERRVHGKACFRIRKLKGLTQAQVATNAGMGADGQPVLDHTTVSHIEAGRQPTEAVMAHLANGLGVSLDEITYQAVVYVVNEAVA